MNGTGGIPAGCCGEGWLVDAGNMTRTYEVEVEEDMYETFVLDPHGQGYLANQTFNATGGVIVVNFGKQLSEQGRVVFHDGNFLRFAHVPCPDWDPPYHSCRGDRAFTKVNSKGIEQGFLSYFLTQKLELLDVESEWHFEPASGGGGRLFVLVTGGASEHLSRI